MAQPIGSYPRLNAAMLQSGKYEQMIVSLIGKIVSHDDDDGMGRLKFQCADGGVIQLSTEQAEIPTLAEDSIVEIVGQAMSLSDVMVFVVREMTPDMNLDLYNRMLKVQSSDKFAQYFAPVDDNMMQQ